MLLFLIVILGMMCWSSQLPCQLQILIAPSLDKVFRLHNGHGVQISQIRCDNEFRSLFEPIKDDLDVEMEYTAAQDHQTEAERNNRFIKERVRSTNHRLPYRSIPKIMIKYLVEEMPVKANYFPAKGGISKYYSPRQLLTKQGINYDHH